MIFYIVVAETAFKSLKNISNRDDNISLIVDDAIHVPEWVSEQYDIIFIKEASDESDKIDCKTFTREYERLNELPLYPSEVEPHINGIYEYVVSPINNILHTIDSNISAKDEIHLIGGNHRVKIGAYYAVKSPEFNKNILIDRADVLNPFLYEALKNNGANVIYNDSAHFRTLSKYTFRVFSIFCYSFLMTLVKYMTRCFKGTKSDNLLKFDQPKNFVIFPVRSNPQLDFVDSIASSLPEVGSQIEPIVFYYEMLMGKSFFNRLSENSYPCLSLYSYKYVFLLLITPFVAIAKTLINYSVLRKRPALALSSGKYNYTLPITYIVFENLAAPHTLFYRSLLNQAIRSLARKENVTITGVCSTEMIGTQAFIEHMVSRENLLRFINIQTSVVYDRYYPVKVVGEMTFCLSDTYAISFNTKGIHNKGNAHFIGSLKYLRSDNIMDNCASKELSVILFATQPYEPELTLNLLLELSDWVSSKQLSIKLRVRIHPRDDINNYTALKNVEFVSNSETIKESINSASLVLTRTSSVVLDAINYKIPYLVCKLSSFDEKTDLSFLSNPRLSVFNADELITKLSQFEAVYSDFLELLEHQFSQSNNHFRSEETINKFLSAFDYNEKHSE